MLPGWTDRPADIPHKGQSIVYVIPGVHLMRTDKRLYGKVIGMKDGKVAIELDKRDYAEVTFRFNRQEDGQWRRNPKSSCYLLFKEGE